MWKSYAYPFKNIMNLLSLNQFSLYICLILFLSACNSDDKENHKIPQTDNINNISILDKELRSLITINNLTGDPSLGIDLPNIKEPLAQLGLQLFFSKALSGDNDVACVSCHHPLLGSGDNLSLSIGVGAEQANLLGSERKPSQIVVDFDGGANIARNAPTIFNIGLWKKFMFHDGSIEKVDNQIMAFGEHDLISNNIVESQVSAPVVSVAEMRGFTFANSTDAEFIKNAIVQRLLDQTIPNTWLEEFRKVFANENNNLSDNELLNFPNIAYAIATYERSQLFINNSWKIYVEGNNNAISTSAKHGAILFFNSIEDGGANCVNCHKSDFFTDEEFHILAIPQIGRGKNDGEDFGRFNQTKDEKDKYAFRTPTLLNIEVTAPYGHDGAYKTLEAIVRHNLDVNNAIDKYDFSLQNLDFGIQKENAESNTLIILEKFNNLAKNKLEKVILNDEQITDLVNFLLTLTDPCVKDKKCLANWLPNENNLGVDNLQLNAIF
jgi:cytochrome c peroxidase